MPVAGVAHGWRTWASADFDPGRSAIGVEAAGPKREQPRLTDVLARRLPCCGKEPAFEPFLPPKTDFAIIILCPKAIGAVWLAFSASKGPGGR